MAPIQTIFGTVLASALFGQFDTDPKSTLPIDKQAISVASDQSTDANSQPSRPTANKPLDSKTAQAKGNSSPQAIFLREFHTPQKPADEITRRAKLNW